MDFKKITRWQYRSKTTSETLAANNLAQGGMLTSASSIQRKVVQFEAGAQQLIQLRKNTAKVIGSAISTPISDQQRSRAKELVDRARLAQASSVTARFQR